ncbi:MAG: hypothetical protein ACE5NP_02735 [Anaerolineae bacterium]
MAEIVGECQDGVYPQVAHFATLTNLDVGHALARRPLLLTA